jgi:hypothetical protein
MDGYIHCIKPANAGVSYEWGELPVEKRNFSLPLRAGSSAAAIAAATNLNPFNGKEFEFERPFPVYL